MAEPTGFITLVEDDDVQLRLIQAILQEDGWHVTACHTGQEALATLDRGDEVDVVLTDLMMPEIDGRAVLEAVMARRPEVPVIILTANASVEAAVELLHAGAHHYLAKPTKLAELRIVVRRAKESTEARRELARLRRRISLPSDVVGVSRQMLDILETAIRVAPTATPVLVTGESGTGKEVVARAIHSASGRAGFVPFNCAAIAPNLFEAELFGARTSNGDAGKPGVVEVAANGTLFLEEVAEVPIGVQPALLRFLEEGEYHRAGETELRKARTRLIAATSRVPAEEIAAGRLREDLFYRLSVVHLHLPPLRERPVDVPALAETLLRRLADRYQLEHAELAPDALAALTAWRWPGNVRELETVLARALALRSGRFITLKDLPGPIAKGGPHGHTTSHPPATTLTLEEVEKRHILAVLEKVSGNKLKAAEILGIDRSTLHRKLKQIQGLAALQL